jgi:hypothetical protein
MTKLAKFRYEGEIKPLTTNRFPSHFIFWDTETTVPDKLGVNDTFDLKLGSMVYVSLDKNQEVKDRQVYYFYSAMEFAEIVYRLLPQKSAIWLYCHNTGFDVRVLDLPNLFNSLGWDSVPPIINERAFIWKIRTPKGGLTFLDTANYGVQSVGELGASLKFPKLDIDFDTCSKEELEIYCLNDVLIIEKFVIEYVQYMSKNELGGLKSTLASQAMSGYRARFIQDAPVIHNNEKALQLERDGYHGGRVECRFIGKLPQEDYYYLDVNSMYPYCMIGNELPKKLLGYTENVMQPFWKVRLGMYYNIADVEIETDEPVYPLYYNHKLIFPVGRFRTVLYNPELLYAYNHNHIRKAYRWAIYDTGNLFTNYVDFFYSAKVAHTKEGNLSARYIDKLFLNSLYGKFGQLNPTRTEGIETDFKGVYRLPQINFETKLHWQEIAWYGKTYKEYKEGETRLSCPSIAGAITAKGRMTLWQYITIAGLSNVFYWDTDSLIVNTEGYTRLLSSISTSDIGKVKLEGKSSILEIRGNKDYTFGDESKTKGVPKKATQLTQDTWEYLQFQGFISWLNAGASGAPKGHYTQKVRRHKYNKGVVLPDGNVIPFSFPLNVQPL